MLVLLELKVRQTNSKKKTMNKEVQGVWYSFEFTTIKTLIVFAVLDKLFVRIYAREPVK